MSSGMLRVKFKKQNANVAYELVEPGRLASGERFLSSNDWSLEWANYTCTGTGSTAGRSVTFGGGCFTMYARSLPAVARAVADANGRKNVVDTDRDEGVLV